MDKQSQNILIVGASRGVGAALAGRLLQRPHVGQLFAAARSVLDSPALAELAHAHGKRLVTIPMDIADESSIEAAVGQMRDQTDRIDTVINTVGLLHNEGMQPERKLGEVAAGNILASFTVNSIGWLLLAKHVAPLLPRREPCTLATLSARVGSIGDNRLGGWYSYRAAKAAQNMLTKTLSIELRRKYRRVRCVALHPGTVATDLSAPFRGNVDDDKLFTTEQSADYLLGVLDKLDDDDNGKFFAWDGQEIPW